MPSQPRPALRRRAVGTSLAAVAALLSALLAPVLVAGPAAAASYTIQGRVTNTSGNPVAGVQVLDENSDTETTTTADGRYTLAVTGRYHGICFNEDGAFADYEQDCTYGRSAGEPVLTVDRVLRRYSSISGTLSPRPTGTLTPVLYAPDDENGDDGDGSGSGYHQVYVYPEASYDASNGRYTVPEVVEGSYRLCFVDGNYDQYGCLGGAWPETATALNLGPSPMSVPTQGLAGRGTLTGTVTNSGPGVEVTALRRVVVGGETHWVDSQENDATSAGRFSFTLPPGSYAVRYDPYDSDYLTSYYANQTSIANATEAAVTSGRTVTLAAQTLPKASVISGTVHMPSGADYDEGRVVVRDATTGERVDSAYVEDDGTYEVGGLAAGSYKVDFDRRSGTAIGVAQFFDGVAEKIGLAGARVIQLLQGQRFTANATIARGGVLLGRVLDEANDPINGARVLAYTEDGSLVTRSVLTNGDGVFSLTGLGDGDYRVAVDPRGGHGLGFYTGGRSLSGTKTSAIAVTSAPGARQDLGELSFGSATVRPVAGQPPTISGTPKVGSLLIASPGGWTPSGTSYAYQWSAADAPIAGATQPTYTPVQSDVGKTLTVEVTASQSGYTSASAVSAPTTAVQPITITRGAAGISGTAKVGYVLTAVPSGWAPGDVNYAYRWMANGVTIPGATARTFAPGASQVGRSITVAITGSRAGSPAVAPVTSGATARVAAGTFRLLRSPSIHGTGRARSVLAVTAGSVSPAATVRYQWLRNGAAIARATGSAYRLTTSDVRRYVSLRVTYSRSGYTSLVRYTNRVGPVRK